MRMKYKLNAFLFFLGLFIFIQTISETTLTEISIIDTFLFFVRNVLLIAFVYLAIINLKFKKKSFVFLIVGALAITINMIFFKGGNTLTYIFFIALAYQKNKSSSIDDVLDVTLKLSLISELFVVFLCLIGVLQDGVSSREISIYSGSFFVGNHYRHTLGFVNHNQLAMFFMDFLSLYIIKKGKAIRGVSIATMFILSYVVYSLSNSRAIFILSSLMLLGTIYFKMRYSIKKHTINVASNAPVWIVVPALFVISFLTAYLFDQSNWGWAVVNEVLSGRIFYAQQVILHYGKSFYSLFGHGIEAGTAADYIYIVDNGYIKEVLQRGVMISLLLMYMWTKLIKSEQAKSNVFTVFCLVLLCFANFVNDQFISYRLVPIYCMVIDMYRLDKKKVFSNGFNYNSRLQNN